MQEGDTFYTLDFPGYSTITLTKGESGTPGNYPEQNEFLISGNNPGGNLIRLRNTALTEALASCAFEDGFTKRELAAIGLRTRSTGRRGFYTEVSDVDEPDKTTATAPAYWIQQTSSYFGEVDYNGRERLLFDEDGTFYLNDRMGSEFFKLSKTGRVLSLTPAQLNLSCPIEFTGGISSNDQCPITLGVGIGSQDARRIQFVNASYSGYIFTTNGGSFGIGANGQRAALWDTNLNLVSYGSITALGSLNAPSLVVSATGNAAIILQSTTAGSGRKVLIEHTQADQLRFSMFSGTTWSQPLSFDSDGNVTLSNTLTLPPIPRPPNPAPGMVYTDANDGYAYHFNGITTTWNRLSQ